MDRTDLGAEILQIPYANNEYQMSILLPKKVNGLSELELKLRTIDVATLNKPLPVRRVALSLPKFKITYQISLNKALQNVS